MLGPVQVSDLRHHQKFLSATGIGNEIRAQTLRVIVITKAGEVLRAAMCLANQQKTCTEVASVSAIKFIEGLKLASRVPGVELPACAQLMHVSVIAIAS